MKFTRILAVAGLLAWSGAASAAPVSGLPTSDQIGAAGIVKVHGDHRGCEEGRHGWHRHDRYGERVPCSPPAYGRPHQDHNYGRPQHHHGSGPTIYAPRQPVYPHKQRCVKDWHCEKSGPFGVNKRCYWRDLCH